MSLRGVVENLVATASSQDCAFCSDTPGAAETMSEPTDARPLSATPHSTAAEPLALLTNADAIAIAIAIALLSTLRLPEDGTEKVLPCSLDQVAAA